MKCCSLITLLSLTVFAFHGDLTFAEQDSCRRLKFSSPVDGFALEGHVIKNISLSVGMSSSCIGRCTMESHCASINIGPSIKDHVLCQLCDSDRILHPEDLRPKEGFTYRGTENVCSSSPCFHNATCLNGFTDKRYRCLCPIGYTGGNCEIELNCKELYSKNLSEGNKAYPLKVGSVEVPIYCHMTDDLGACEGGGWTLVMKIDGNKTTFHYDSNLWSNKTSHNLAGGMTGFDSQETKLPTYWSRSFSKICLGMKIDKQINFIVINETADSLYSLIADGQYRNISLGRDTWKTLIGLNASLQTNCTKEGFNAWSILSKARIGILGNEQVDCYSPDSRIGFGTGGDPRNSSTCGNEADGRFLPDNGEKHIEAMGYILVQ